MPKNPPSPQELLALEAILDGMDDPESALLKLQGKKDPDSIAARISLLVEAGRASEAVAQVRGLEPHPRWVDRAAGASGAAGEVRNGRDLIEQFAANNPDDFLTYCRSMAAFAEGVLKYCDASGPMSPIGLSQNVKGVAAGALDTIASLLDLFVVRAPVNQLQRLLVEHALRLAFLCSDEDRTAKAAAILGRMKPIPLELAHAVIRDQLPRPPANLAERLRTEHPGNFEAQFVAALIQGTVLKEPEKAVFAAIALIDGANAEEQLELGKLLFQLLGAVDESTAKEIRVVLEKVWPPDSRFAELLSVEKLLSSGNLDEAQAMLDRLKDETDSHWLQIAAHCHLAKGDRRAALAHFSKAIDIAPHASLLRAAIGLAMEERDWETAERLLLTLKAVHPRGLDILQRLAFVYVKQGNDASAADLFRQLADLDPQEPQHRLNEAISRARAGDLQGSLQVYESVRAEGDTALHAVLGHSHVLEALGRVDDAFALLASRRDQWWNDSRFVTEFMSVCYRSLHDDMAQTALLRLQELQSSGDASQRVLHPVTMDDLREHATRYHEKRDFLLTHLLQGKVPWLFVDEHLNQVPYFAWAIRTQPMNWIAEVPLQWSQYSVYSTHAFAVLEVNGHRQLCDLVAPERLTPIVVDLSALITLHRLDMLSEAAAYFGAITIPAAYFSQVLDYARRLLPHQLSLRAAPTFVQSGIESGRIAVVEHSGSLPIVDEHCLDGVPVYRLIDLAQALYDAGLVGQAEFQRLREASHRASGVTDARPAIIQGQDVEIASSTLQTLNTIGLADLVVSMFKVHVSSADRREALQTMQAYAFADQVYQWNSELWDTIRSDSRFTIQPTPAAVRTHAAVGVTREGEEQVEEEANSLSDSPMLAIEAALLATSLKRPLLADDRASQVLMWSTFQSGSPNAFGTERFLEALVGDPTVGDAKLAECFLQIMRWRYRFVIPPPCVLKALADQFRQAPPGRQLKEVAAYVHDCMMDPGLLGGFEATSPPTSMGARLFQTWCAHVAEFVAMVWEDLTYTPEAAAAFTDWAVAALLPSPPSNLNVGVQRVLAQLCPTTVMSAAVLRLIRIEDDERASTAIAALADALGLEGENYLRTISEIVDVDYGQL